MLKVFLNDDTWDFLAILFKMKCAAFQQLITIFVEIFEEWSFNWLVMNKKPQATYGIFARK